MVFCPKKHFLPVLAAAAFLFASPHAAYSATLATCNANFTLCQVPENTSLVLPFLIPSGDVILIDPVTNIASDVFRISNNFIDTGAGTGLGNLAFLYSSDESPLPLPSTYSANVVFVPESPTGITTYVGNGTPFLLGVPEPRTCALLSAATMALWLFRRRLTPATQKG